MNVLVQDFHSAWRQLSNNPGLSVIAVLTLTLGIGANTAIFSVLNAVLLRPLPFDDPSRLVWLSNYRPGLKDTMVATPDFLAWRSQSRCIRGLAAYDEGDFNLTGAGDPERIHGVFATASLFSVLQVQPAIGRAMRNEESAPGSTPVVILSHEFWRRRFGGDGSVIGNHIALDGTVFEVIGIMPAGSVFPSDNPRPDVIVPLSLPQHPGLTGPQGVEVIQVIGRLSPGVTLAQAEAELSTIEQRLIATYPPGYRNMTEGTETQVIPLQEKLAGKSRPVLLVLLGSVILLLLIASVNTANMQLAKATARRKELALRTALGASRYRLSRQLLCESLLLSLLGGGAGVILAVEAIGVLNRMRPTGLPQFARVGLNDQVLGFTAVVAILTGIVSGLAPAIFACRAGSSDAVKDGIQANTESRGLHFVRRLLVVSEVSLAAVLLVGSGLLIRSFIGLVRIDPGFEPRQLLTLQIALPEAKYSAPSQQRAFFENLSQKLKALPDVTHVGATSELPLTGNTQTAAVLFEGRPAPPPGLRPWIPLGTVTPDYFHTMGIPLVAGREFGYGDRPGSPIVGLVNQAFWRRFFPAENPIGKRIQRGTHNGWVTMTIVGVVGDVRNLGLQTDPSPKIFASFAQDPQAQMSMALRIAATNPVLLASAVREQVWALDKEQPTFDVATMEERMAESLSTQRWNMRLLTAFALTALVLAAAGIYGVISYFALRRTHEIGVRMALGATPQSILALVLRQGATTAVLGSTLGIAASFALTGFIRGMIYGIRVTDPATYVAVGLLLTGVALLASYIPARRAAEVDPMVALRYQ